LALHEEYGATADAATKIQIFNKLRAMDEGDFLKSKRIDKFGGNSGEVSTAESSANPDKPWRQPAKSQSGLHNKSLRNASQNPVGQSEYKKTVIQLEKERVEKEKQQLIIKRKRNSNYIQQCIRHGNEHYSHEKLNSLNWLRPKAGHTQDHGGGADSAGHSTHVASKADDENLERLRKKQEILAKYNKMSKDNKPAEDGFYRFTVTRGNNSALVRRVLMSRGCWQELEQQHLTLYSFKWAQVSRFINYE
jgi:hypothetical protein